MSDEPVPQASKGEQPPEKPTAAPRKRAAPKKKRVYKSRAKKSKQPDATVTQLPPNLKLRSGRNIAWIEEHCVIPEGKNVGQPVRLTAKQRRWMVRIYDTPTRTFILSMGKKGAKTAFVSFLLLLHLVGPEAKPNSQLYSAAQSRDQASVIFNYAAKCVRLSQLHHYVSIADTQKVLKCQELGTTYRALSAEASTAHGLSPAFAVHDELGQVRGPRSDLFDAIESAFAAQEEPLSIIISTQAPSPDDLLSMLIDDALTGADPKVKIELYTAPMEMDPFSEEAIRAANPHYDELMNQEEVRKQAADAKRLPSKESSYRNLVLNQRVEARLPPLVSRQVWKENGNPPRELKGKKVYAGLDLSSVNDLTALVLLSEDFDIVPTFWLPSDGIEARSRNDRVPYDKWAEQGYINLTPGRTIEYEFIAEYLRGLFDSLNIVALGFDRYNMRFLKPWLTNAGFSEKEMEKFIEFGQGFVSMSPAIREVEGMLLSRKARHGNHPVLTMCAANAVTMQDPAGNRKFAKQRASGRIDGMVALATACAMIPPQAGAAPEKKFQMFFV